MDYISMTRRRSQLWKHINRQENIYTKRKEGVSDHKLLLLPEPPTPVFSTENQIFISTILRPNIHLTDWNRTSFPWHPISWLELLSNGIYMEPMNENE